MLLRSLIFVLAIVCGVGRAMAQTLPIVNLPGKEWVVSYEAKEDWPKLKFKKRPIAAIRLQIRQNADMTYSGMLWLFTGTATMTGTTYSFLGKTDWVVLDTEGDASGRDRVGFQAKNIDVKNGSTTVRKIHIHGVWQHGRDRTSRAAERVQLKINHHAGGGTPVKPAQAPPTLPAPSGCEDDPDSDVLEEAGSPMGSDPDAPPTDP